MLPIIEVYGQSSTAIQIEYFQRKIGAICYIACASKNNQVIKACSCGRQHFASDWLRLPLVGYQFSEFMCGEMRNCKCGSTMFAITWRKA